MVANGPAGRDGKRRGRTLGLPGPEEGFYNPHRRVFHPAGTHSVTRREEGWARMGESGREPLDHRRKLGLTPFRNSPIPELRLHLLLRICPPIRLLDRPDPAPRRENHSLCLVQDAMPPLGLHFPPCDLRSWSTQPLPGLILCWVRAET